MGDRILNAIIARFDNQEQIRIEMNNSYGNVIRAFGIIDNMDVYDNYVQLYLDNQVEVEISFRGDIEYDEDENCFSIYSGDNEMYLYL